MNREIIYSKKEGEIEVSPTEIINIKSTHTDYPTRDYQVWKNCDINGEALDLFVIPRHDPWIDERILLDPKLTKQILNYSQQDNNNLVKIFKLTNEIAITEYHEEYTPLLIKSANNFYSPEYKATLNSKVLKHFEKKKTAQDFYHKVIRQYEELSNKLGITLEDVCPNNILMSPNFEDFKIIDVSSLRKSEFVNKYSLTQIIYGDGANDIGTIDSIALNNLWMKEQENNSPITFCVSSFNNLNYLKLLVNSVRENSFFKNSPFIVHAENCNDGTNEWLEKSGSTLNLEYYIEDNATPKGIGGGMNLCASKVKTEFILFLHADFYVGKNHDIELLKFFDKYPSSKMWAFSSRIQPNLGGELPRPGTLPVPPKAFGEYHDNFNAKKFLLFAEEYKKRNNFEIRKTEGVSGLIRKKDWDYMGGNDPRFAPAYWEDADLFMRMANEGFKFVLTSNSVVYHFGSRASRFPDDNLNHRPTHLEDIEKRSLYRFIDKYGRIPDRDQNDFYIPIPIVDGSPNRLPLE